ncbi:MAG: DUF4874 domain-containing protein [Oscillospiraceae bacterium]|nr:DUF4874 domain-containing protein [Oscillospiraceae bacterium]
MKNKLKIIIAVIAVVLIFLTGFAAAVYKNWWLKPDILYQAPALPGAELPRLPSEAAETGFTAEFALPTLTPENAGPLLKNPDRGLRMETYMTLGDAPECYPGDMGDPYEKLLNFIEKYREDSPTVVQLYVYLCRYNNRPLDENAFSQLERMFELCREQKIRVLLRFAYQNESNPDAGYKRVDGHLQQIGEWFGANGQLVDDVVYCVQAGIVGYWGEGHNNKNFKSIHIGRAFDRLRSITPDDIYIQVRNVDLLQKVSWAPLSFGMHDDYIIGEKNGEWSFFLGKNDEEEKLLEERFKNTVNDGEMPWGVATYYDKKDGEPLDSIDPVAVLGQIKQYSLTTLSLEHNYREGDFGRVFSMERWKDVPVTPGQLEALDMPYLPSLFENGEMSAYDYIRYHLGYLLSVTSFEFDETQNKIRFTIQNSGFAAPLNFNALSVVIDGTEYLIGSYDKYALGSMRAVAYTAALPYDFIQEGPHEFNIKLARRAGSDICVRFANENDIFC